MKKNKGIFLFKYLIYYLFMKIIKLLLSDEYFGIKYK